MSIYPSDQRFHVGGLSGQELRKTCQLMGLVLFLATSLLVSSAQAQIYSGSLTGVVTDPSGAVVPGAKVKLTDVDKGFSYDTETDSTGRYVLRSLPPSKYRLSVALIGFNTHVQDGIVLNVNQNASVDVSLKLGAETQTVDVLAAAPGSAPSLPNASPSTGRLSTTSPCWVAASSTWPLLHPAFTDAMAGAAVRSISFQTAAAIRPLTS